MIRPWQAAMGVAVVLGAGAILYSLITDYELGVIHILPMGAHLRIDLIVGILLIASPWLFGFADRVIWPCAEAITRSS